MTIKCYEVILGNGSVYNFCDYCIPDKYQVGKGTINLEATSKFIPVEMDYWCTEIKGTCTCGDYEQFSNEVP